MSGESFHYDDNCAITEPDVWSVEDNKNWVKDSGTCYEDETLNENPIGWKNSRESAIKITFFPRDMRSIVVYVSR